MKTRFFAASIMCLLFIAVASAQQYSIRANRGLNLRAAPSLNAEIAGTVGTGAILHVVGHTGNWLKVGSGGNDVWLADWVNYSRVEGSKEVSSQTGTTADIDNCCFVDRQCNSDQEWVNGFHAYQNGECAAPLQTQTGMTTQPTVNESAQINNCCFAGWQCATDRDWVNGYHAYQNNQCGAGPSAVNADSCCQLGWNCAYDFDFIMGKWWLNELGPNMCGSPQQMLSHGVILEGSGAFIAHMAAALNHLQRTAPDWYIYSINATKKIRESLIGSGTLGMSYSFDPWFIGASIPYMAAIIVHESCHLQRNVHVAPHRGPIDEYEEEAVCDTVAISSLQAIGPGTVYTRDRIDEYYSRGGSPDIVAQDSYREWERAKHLLSTQT